METKVISYCEKLGLGPEQRQSRLARFDLTPADLSLASTLQNVVIKPHLEQIASQFYQRLAHDGDAQKIFAQGFQIHALIDTMKEYLCSLGIGFDQVDYFERRIKVGFVHARIGVDLELYHSAYFVLQKMLIECLSFTEMQDRSLAIFILKITSFDLSLAVEAYHRAHVFGLEQRIDAMRHEAEFLQSRLEVDALTQVLSRSSIIDFLSNALSYANSTKELSCVVMADIDHFKRVNDRFGHLVGDEVLRHVADRIKKSLRQNDAVGRYGGEEFLIVLGDIDVIRAREIAERIRLHVADNGLRLSREFVSVTISLGIAQINPGDSVESAIERADKAMYKAKANGRNRVELA